MKVYDISTEIYPDMTVYKNNPKKHPVIEVVDSHKTASHHQSQITMDLHTGTHIDAPLHMIDNGQTMSMYKVEDFVTDARVIDLTHIKDRITKDDLMFCGIKEGDFILFKTRNSNQTDFDFDFVYLEESGARYLQELGIKGVGTDALGIERSQSGHETHKILLGHGIMIIEGLRLQEVNPGNYLLVAAPLKILQTEAAPVRALLIDM